jgi:hypothetical protein
MNEHSAQRLSLARQIATSYAAHPQIEAILVFGSVAHGWADEYSDLEMAYVWSEQPSPEVSRAAAASVGADGWRWDGDEETSQAWGEKFRHEGLEVENAHWTRTAVDGIVSDVLERYDITQHGLMFNKQATVAALVHGIVLHGEALIHGWRQRAADYPDGLSLVMVQKHLRFGPFGSREMLAERDEIPLLYENNCHSVRLLLPLLFGLNRLYSPSFKWTRNHIKEMGVKPRDFFPRLQQVFQSDCVRGTRELRQLIEETFDLVEKHLPQIDLTQQRETFKQPYRTWKSDTAPETE